MSSYLVAMAVGDFQCLEGGADGTPIRICATPDKKALGQIALESAEQILTFYNGYYAIKYPFGKLDVVAVPDFAAGAMENTAAIFYRETDLLAETKSRVGRHAQDDRLRPRARDGAPVVRQPGHDAVVGRPVAERGLRDLDGEQAARRVEAGVEHCCRRGAGDAGGAQSRLPGRDARDPLQGVRRPPRSTGRSTRSPTKRAPPSCGWSRATWGRRRSSRA